MSIQVLTDLLTYSSEIDSYILSKSEGKQTRKQTMDIEIMTKQGVYIK